MVILLMEEIWLTTGDVWNPVNTYQLAQDFFHQLYCLPKKLSAGFLLSTVVPTCNGRHIHRPNCLAYPLLVHRTWYQCLVEKKEHWIFFFWKVNREQQVQVRWCSGFRFHLLCKAYIWSDLHHFVVVNGSSFTCWFTCARLHPKIPPPTFLRAILIPHAFLS